MRPKTPSLAPPIIFGIFLVLAVLVLTALWNIALFTGWWRSDQTAIASPGYWVFLISGYLLFLAVIVGVILFIVWLAKQIRLNQRQQNFIDSVIDSEKMVEAIRRIGAVQHVADERAVLKETVDGGVETHESAKRRRL